MQPPQELDIQSGAVHTKVLLQRGCKFGPYLMNWTEDPRDKQLAWEVSFVFAPVYFAAANGKLIQFEMQSSISALKREHRVIICAALRSHQRRTAGRQHRERERGT